MSGNKFELDTEDVLGYGYQEYLSNIRGVAISQSSEYYKLRSALMRTIKRDAVKNLYTSIFQALSKGCDINGRPIQSDEGNGTVVLGRGSLVPMYPSQKVNDFAVEVSAMLGEHLNKIVDLLMPDEFEKIAAKKLQIKGAANSIDIST
jgi:hypothetical protein